jgi:membrane-associated phospholipid phosphatase
MNRRSHRVYAKDYAEETLRDMKPRHKHCNPLLKHWKMWKWALILMIPIALTASAQQDSLNIKDTVFTDTIKSSIISHDINSAKSFNTRQKFYKLKPLVDVPIVAIGTGWSLYAFTKIYTKDSSTTEEILSLNKNDIPAFDRWATKYWNPKSYNSGNALFYAAMPLPLVVSLVDNKLRKDYFKLSFMYLESMSITGLLYTGSVYFVDRHRPYAYNPNVDMSQKVRGGAKNSFYSGHVALVASSTFFTATILSDYHPNSKFKWLYYTLAGATTATMAYTRLKAGQHFPSDLLLGIAQGTLTGILVPKLHKSKFVNDHVSIAPLIGDQRGVAVAYRF